MNSLDKTCFLIDNIKDHHEQFVGDGFVIASKLIKKFNLNSQNLDNNLIFSSLIFKEIIKKNHNKLKPFINLINNLDNKNLDQLQKISKNIKSILQKNIDLSLDKNVLDIIKQTNSNLGYIIRRKIIINNNQTIQNVQASDLVYNNKQIIVSSKNKQDILKNIKSLYISLYNQQEILEREKFGLDHLDVSVIVSLHQVDLDEVNSITLKLDTNDLNIGLGIMSAEASQGFEITNNISNQYIYSLHQNNLDYLNNLENSAPVIKRNINKKSNLDQILSEDILSKIGLIGKYLLNKFGTYQIRFYIYNNNISIISIDKIFIKNTQQYPNSHSLWIGETGETNKPITHVKAVSFGVCFSEKPHKNVLFLKNLHQDAQDAFNIKKLTENISAVLVEASEVSVIDNNIINFLRERGIVCLVGCDIKEIEKQKKITILADKNLDKNINNHDGFIYDKYINFEYKKPPISQEKLQTKLYSAIHDVNNIKNIALLPISGVYYDLSDLFLYHGLSLNLFFDKNIDVDTKKEILNLACEAKNRSQVLKILIKQSVSLLAAVISDRKVIIKIPWFNDLLDRDLDSKKKYLDIVYIAISEVVTEYKFNNISVISDYQKTPEHFELFVKKFLKNKDIEKNLQIGLHVDMYRNEMLSSEFAVQADVAIFDQNKVLDNINSSRKIINTWNHKKTQTIICADSHKFNNTQFEQLMQLNIRGMVVEPDLVLKYHQSMTFLEKTIGNKGKKTNIPITMMVAGIGAIFALLILLVSGFNAVRNPVTVLNGSSNEISPSELRMKLMDRAERLKEEEFDAQRSTLQVSDFAQFTMDYPSWWRVSYWNGGVTVTDPKTGEFISIFRQLVGHPIDPSRREKINIDGYQAEKFSDQLPKDGTSVDIVEIDVDDEIIEINATSERFVELLTTFKFIDTSGLNGKTPSHWDVRDGNFCVQMITYARKNKDDSCQVFSTPCDVPEYWEVCDSNDL